MQTQNLGRQEVGLPPLAQPGEIKSDTKDQLKIWLERSYNSAVFTDEQSKNRDYIEINIVTHIIGSTAWQFQLAALQGKLPLDFKPGNEYMAIVLIQITQFILETLKFNPRNVAFAFGLYAQSIMKDFRRSNNFISVSSKYSTFCVEAIQELDQSYNIAGDVTIGIPEVHFACGLANFNEENYIDATQAWLGIIKRQYAASVKIFLPLDSNDTNSSNELEA